MEMKLFWTLTVFWDCEKQSECRWNDCVLCYCRSWYQWRDFVTGKLWISQKWSISFIFSVSSLTSFRRRLFFGDASVIFRRDCHWTFREALRSLLRTISLWRRMMGSVFLWFFRETQRPKLTVLCLGVLLCLRPNSLRVRWWLQLPGNRIFAVEFVA